MKIAATGYVSEQAGSVASANALLLRALLDAGHEVDFFSKPSFVDPRPCVGEHAGFRFIPTDNVGPDRFRARVQHLPVIGFLACRVDSGTYSRLLLQNISKEHAHRRYDLCLWLGDYAPGRVKNLPMISFAQGPPGTDARSIISRFTEILRLAGLKRALPWYVLAHVRLSPAGLPPLRHSDHLIVGSRQSQRTLHELYGISPERTSALPYPIDLNLFHPAAEAATHGADLRVVWLGRVIPRKRLDLFLRGLELAIRQGLRVKATIVGGIGFVPGYEKMIESFPFPDRLRWIKSLPRTEVPALLHAHDVLVQPSDEENFGSSVAEAQACGLRTIVGRTNGNADFLCERDIHLEDDRPETLAQALTQMARTPAADAQASRTLAENCFDLQQLTAQLTTILQTAIGSAEPVTSLPSTMKQPTIDVIIPTLKRPDDLRRCLVALSRQETPATHIYVGIRADDELSRTVLLEFEGKLSVHAVEARGVGVVGSMNSCLAECRSEWIALLDDDVEIPAHWMSSMLRHALSRSDVVAAGGRDLLMDYPEMRRTEPLVQDVGQVHWYGRITGGHHRGGGKARTVQVLRGSNCLYNADFLHSCGFERGLRGKGAQVNWELALGLQARARGMKMIFDPTVGVVHNVAPRHDGDTVHRGIFNFEGTSDIAYNETFVVLQHGRGLTRISMLLWLLCIGSHVCPGLARATDLILKPGSQAKERLTATFSGRLAAIRHFLHGDSRSSHPRTSVQVSEVKC